MTKRALNPSHYEKLTSIERFEVAMEALGRGDYDELGRLAAQAAGASDNRARG